jgi:hypothetical protein
MEGIRYQGFYSTVSRGLRQKEKQDALILLHFINNQEFFLLFKALFWIKHKSSNGNCYQDGGRFKPSAN